MSRIGRDGLRWSTRKQEQVWAAAASWCKIIGWAGGSGKEGKGRTRWGPGRGGSTCRRLNTAEIGGYGGASGWKGGTLVAAETCLGAEGRDGEGVSIDRVGAKAKVQIRG